MPGSPFHFAFFVKDIASTRRFVGESVEQMTMFLLDPSGNALELKSFKHPEHAFTA